MPGNRTLTVTKTKSPAVDLKGDKDEEISVIASKYPTPHGARLLSIGTLKQHKAGFLKHWYIENEGHIHSKLHEGKERVYYAPGSDFQSQPFLKNLLPLFPMPDPAMVAETSDFVSGLHFRSFSEENSAESAWLVSLSFMLLQDTTLRLRSSFDDRRTCSRPSIVSREQPSMDRNFTLLSTTLYAHHQIPFF
nr:hypothetical protein Iba_chr11dCG9180 [Ipomoea batatas]